jgi:uridine kinase
MNEQTCNEVIRFISAELLEAFRANPDKVAIIGTSGGVASGKSRFTTKLRKTLCAILPAEVVYLPFDLWINQQNLESPTYCGRFFLNEFQSALESIASGNLWFCPRHDLAKHEFGEIWDRLTYEAAEVSWQHRSFRKVSSLNNLPDIAGASGVYADMETKRLYSLFLPKRGSVYITDGTLVFQTEKVKSLYDYMIFVVGSWPERVARMIRRFNRHEVFGKTNETELGYVSFLVAEAKQCADSEIEQQRNDSMLVVRSSVETISNLLDLYHLHEELVNPEYAEAYALRAEEVDAALEAAYVHLGSIHQPEQLLPLREELNHLIESKHLLAVKNADEILARLAGLLMK